MENNYQRDLLIEIGKTIKKLRIQKQMSQTQLGTNICTKATISNIEKGLQKIPNVIMLSKIAKRLDVTITNILNEAESNLNNSSQIAKRKIINLVSTGKYLQAETILNENLYIDKFEEDYKYWCHIKGTISFYNEDYATAKKYFLKGLKNFEGVTSKTIFSYIDIFLVNGFFGCHLNLCLNNEEKHDEVFNEVILKYVYILKNSIDYYIIFEPRTLIRIKIYLMDLFRLFGINEVCEELLKEIEPVIDEYAFYEHKIDLTLASIVYYKQIGKEKLIKETIENTRLVLKAYNLLELEKYLDNKLEEINKVIRLEKQPV